MERVRHAQFGGSSLGLIIADGGSPKSGGRASTVNFGQLSVVARDGSPVHRVNAEEGASAAPEPDADYPFPPGKDLAITLTKPPTPNRRLYTFSFSV